MNVEVVFFDETHDVVSLPPETDESEVGHILSDIYGFFGWINFNLL